MKKTKGWIIKMENKYQTDRENNILIAKRLLVDNIYKSANLEGIAATYAQTVDIINNVAGVKLTPTEIGKICGLRDAWHYLLDNIDAPADLAFLENLHEIAAKAELPYYKLGQIRKEPVLISGTNWRPEIPNPEKLHAELQEILYLESATEQALTADLWVCRNQIFVDGNKRIGNLLANKILIANGNGVVNVPVELDGIFKTKLVAYYESGDMSELKQWMYDNCVDGVTTEHIKDMPGQGADTVCRAENILPPKKHKSR